MKLSRSGRRGQVFGPDGKYRCSMLLESAHALVAELNTFDPRIDREAYVAWRVAKETGE